MEEGPAVVVAQGARLVELLVCESSEERGVACLCGFEELLGFWGIYLHLRRHGARHREGLDAEGFRGDFPKEHAIFRWEPTSQFFLFGLKAR